MRRVLAVAFLVTLVVPEVARAQERCLLRITAPSRNSIGAPGGQGVYTTHLGGGTVTLRCGGAVMTGDSAVHYESADRAEMIGNVDYRDTTRTLTSGRLTYHETSGQVVAVDDVELVRLSTRAQLNAPTVSFFRAGSAGGRTLARGRPHMTIPPEDGPGEAIEVDADEAEFVGDALAIGRGNVVIRRSDFDATADSAVFEGELGRMYGRPVVSARGMQISGDSVHAGLPSGAIDRLHAFGDARGTGESLDLTAGQILVTRGLTDIERLEAFGGRALAAAESFVIAGDSLDVAFTAGQADSVTAVGTGRTFQLQSARDTTAPPVEPVPGVSDEVSWIEGDSLRVWLEPDDDGSPEASEAAAGGRVRRLRAVGDARSYFSGARDSAAVRPSRNYILGRTIEIQFADGEPEQVIADQAIGVYLEPSDSTAVARPSLP